MHNKLMYAVIFTIISISYFCSCSDDDNDTESPVINVEEPMSNDTLSLSVEDSVHIEFSASDNDELHDVSFAITDANGSNVYSYTKDVDAKTFSSHEHFHPTNINSLTAFNIKFDASDHHSNKTSKNFVFYVKP